MEIIDKRSGNFVWKLGSDVLAQQHDPSMLPNGKILIFDNSQFRKNTTHLFSRVIEVDPKSVKSVWEYQDSPPINFFSSHISGARRLFNGNTLITEGFFGRIFQVTLGEVVWEYINPHFQESGGSTINYVFRANHYTSQEIPSLQ